MKKTAIILMLVMAGIGIFQCGLFEPEKKSGSLVLIIERDENASQSLAKPTATLSSVWCIIQKGSNAVYDQNLTKQSDGSFNAEITDFEVGNDYAVLIYGKVNSAIVTRAYKAGVSVSAGQSSTVTLTWASFVADLISLADGATTTDNTPTLDWDDVNGVTRYELIVANNNNFSNPVIDVSSLTGSTYTPSISLADGTYYWKVRCQAFSGVWGGWSEVRSFTIGGEYVVNVSISPEGSGTVAKTPNQSSYSAGTQANLVATPANGYRFARWEGDLSGTEASINFTINNNINVTAVFELITGLTLTVQKNPLKGGTVTISPNRSSYLYGETVTLTATPASGYNFSHWEGDAIGTSASASISMDANKNVTAVFEAISGLSLTVSANPSQGGTVSKSPDKSSYDYSETVTLTATPAAGYQFSSWSGDASGVNTTTTVAMDANKSVTANFSQIHYTCTVTINPTGGGSVSKSPSKTSYTYGESVTLTATPASGYSFVRWEGDVSGTNATINVTMNSDKAITAIFATISGYSLTVSANPSQGGSVTRNPDKSSYTSGEIVTLTATATAGYQFSGWSGDASGTNTVTSVTMNGNKSVIANFTLIGYTLTITISPSNGGSVSKNPNKSTYSYDESVTLTATPATGYSFVRWEGDVTGTNASTNIIINSNKNVTAVFEQITGLSLTVSANPSQGGSITKNPSKTSYTYGESVALAATAATGYQFGYWSGGASGTNTSTTILMDANKTVTANFTQLVYTFTTSVSPTGGGSISKNPEKTTYTYGEVVTLTATPQTGYGFVRWDGDASGTTATTTVTLNGNKSVTAVFAQITGLSLTVSVNPAQGGSVVKNPDKTSYTYGESVTLTASPAAGYQFSYWSGGVSGTNATASVTMNANTTVTANFTQIPYTITTAVSPTGSGSISKSPDKSTYTYGESVTLTASPAIGYQFSSWGGDASGTNATTTVTTNSNKSVTAYFVVTSPVATPTFDPSSGTYTSSQNVTITCSTSGATIHYTTNGVDPTESDPTISSGGSVSISSSTTLKARAYKSGWNTSGVASGTYTITGTVATPTFNPSPGTYTSSQNVTITCSTSGAVIHYSTNGFDPTESDPTVSSGGSVSISSTSILKARAYKSGWNTSEVASGTYTINTAPTAIFTVNPTSGTTTTIFSFDASGSTDAQDATSLLQVRWDWQNDGVWDTGYSTTKTATHQYSSIGSYTVKLEVKDTGGMTNQTQKTIEIVATAFFAEKIACGDDHSLALKSDGTLWVTGLNGVGQLGAGDLSHSNIFIQILNGVNRIACGNGHSLVLKSDGSLWVTGANGAGELGTGDNDYKHTTFQQVMSGVIQISGGDDFSLILKSDGSVWATGDNTWGQLGTGDNNNRNIFTQVLTGVVQIAAGGTHSLALKSDGYVWVTGLNASGQLGTGNNNNRNTFTPVLAGISKIACGGEHSLVIKNDGSLWTTGRNDFGQLGTVDNTNRNSFAPILNGVVDMDAGYFYSIVIKNDGTLWATGLNERGQLGTGDNNNRNTFTFVLSSVSQIACGGAHSLTIKSDGSLWGTGFNPYGMLGTGDYNDRNTFTQIFQQ